MTDEVSSKPPNLKPKLKTGSPQGPRRLRFSFSSSLVKEHGSLQPPRSPPKPTDPKSPGSRQGSKAHQSQRKPKTPNTPQRRRPDEPHIRAHQKGVNHSFQKPSEPSNQPPKQRPANESLRQTGRRICASGLALSTLPERPIEAGRRPVVDGSLGRVAARGCCSPEGMPGLEP